jgi:ribonuclease R
MIFDDQGKIERIVRRAATTPTASSRNACWRPTSAPRLPASHEHPALYRIHEGPTPEKLEKLREFLKEFGLQLGGGDEPHAKDYAKLLARSRAGRTCSCCRP